VLTSLIENDIIKAGCVGVCQSVCVYVCVCVCVYVIGILPISLEASNQLNSLEQRKSKQKDYTKIFGFAVRVCVSVSVCVCVCVCVCVSTQLLRELAGG